MTYNCKMCLASLTIARGHLVLVTSTIPLAVLDGEGYTVVPTDSALTSPTDALHLLAREPRQQPGVKERRMDSTRFLPVLAVFAVLGACSDGGPQRAGSKGASAAKVRTWAEVRTARLTIRFRKKHEVSFDEITEALKRVTSVDDRADFTKEWDKEMLRLNRENASDTRKMLVAYDMSRAGSGREETTEVVFHLDRRFRRDWPRDRAPLKMAVAGMRAKLDGASSSSRDMILFKLLLAGKHGTDGAIKGTVTGAIIGSFGRLNFRDAEFELKPVSFDQAKGTDTDGTRAAKRLTWANAQTAKLTIRIRGKDKVDVDEIQEVLAGMSEVDDRMEFKEEWRREAQRVAMAYALDAMAAMVHYTCSRQKHGQEEVMEIVLHVDRRFRRAWPSDSAPLKMKVVAVRSMRDASLTGGSPDVRFQLLLTGEHDADGAIRGTVTGVGSIAKAALSDMCFRGAEFELKPVSFDQANTERSPAK